MGMFDDLRHVLDQARNGNASEQDLQGAYDRVAQSAPRQTVSEGIAHAFRSDQTPSFPQTIANLFSHSDPNQKAGVLDVLLSKLNPQERKTALGDAPVADTSGPVSPSHVQAIQPQQVEDLATRAERKDPTIIDQAANFYSQHPGLVKNLGAAALALVLARATQQRH